VNRELTYSILAYDEYFGIHDNGTVYVHTVMDAELLPPQLDVTIQATDQGIPALSASATLKIQVNDLNDMAPVFNQAAPTLHVAENETVGKCM